MIEIFVLLPDQADDVVKRKINAEESGSPHMAVHRDLFWKPEKSASLAFEREGWTVTHLPTGLAIIRHVARKADAHRAVAMLADIDSVDWAATDWNVFLKHRVRILDRLQLIEKIDKEEKP
jgi:hypothetical protein